METRLKTTNHAAHSLYYHVILTIKYRNKCLTGEMLDRLRELFAKGCVQWRCRLVEFGGEADHVHLLIEGHPAMYLARMIGNLKTVSARHAANSRLSATRCSRRMRGGLAQAKRPSTQEGLLVG